MFRTCRPAKFSSFAVIDLTSNKKKLIRAEDIVGDIFKALERHGVEISHVAGDDERHRKELIERLAVRRRVDIMTDYEPSLSEVSRFI